MEVGSLGVSQDNWSDEDYRPHSGSPQATSLGTLCGVVVSNTNY